MITRRTLELLKRVLRGPILSDWHWLRHNFTPGTDGYSFFMPVLLEALDRVDQVMPGYADATLTRLEGLSGWPDYQPHYDAIVQILAEVLTLNQLAGHTWPVPPTFHMEPTAGTSKKNPEAVIDLDGVGSLGVEVKAPSLAEHQIARGSRDWQLLAREEFDLRPSHVAAGQPRQGLPEVRRRQVRRVPRRV